MSAVSKRLDKLSKQLSYYLRHKPEDIGLTMDKEGWVRIEQLLSNWPNGQLLLADLHEIVKTDSKGRYVIQTARTTNGPIPMIRAAQGHSTPIVSDMKFAVVTPPKLLYHGTSVESIQAIREKGLLPGSRILVHLTDCKETAVKVGARHGQSVTLVVNAQALSESGYDVYQADNGVYLMLWVPPSFINFPANSETV